MNSEQFDPFPDREVAPYLQQFIEASFMAQEQDGTWQISDQHRRELMATFDLEPSQAAAYAYLAQHRAQEIHEAFVDEDLVAHITGGIHE